MEFYRNLFDRTYPGESSSFKRSSYNPSPRTQRHRFTLASTSPAPKGFTCGQVRYCLGFLQNPRPATPPPLLSIRGGLKPDNANAPSSERDERLGRVDSSLVICLHERTPHPSPLYIGHLEAAIPPTAAL